MRLKFLTSRHWKENERPRLPPVNRLIVATVALPAALAGFLGALFWPDTHTNAFQFWVADVGVAVVMPAVAVALGYLFAGLRAQHLGFVSLKQETSHGSVLTQISLILGAFIAFTPLSFFFASLLGTQDSQPSGTANYFVELLQGENQFLWILYFSFTAAIAEEVVFRGMLAVALIGSDPSDKVVYVVCSALLFGLAHFARGADVVIAATILGVCCALIYLRWRNLWYLILGHFVAGLMSYG